MSAPAFFTIGHSNRSADEFLRLLQDNGIEQVVDVRRLPGSSRYPWFDEDALSSSLADRDIGLERLEPLTGRRGVDREIPFAVNAWWTNRSFHNYADHALSAPFRDALAALRDLGRARRSAVMCAEAVWWRCHRRIIADHLLAAGEQVRHIIGDGPPAEATPSAGAVFGSDGAVTYPAR